MKAAEAGVLVVDDDPDIASAVQTALELEGCLVRSAHNVEDAVALLANGRTSVVLLDYYLAGQCGADFVEQMRQSHPHVPIVLMTAAPDGEEIARKLGACGLLSKPFDLDGLLQIIEQIPTTHARWSSRLLPAVTAPA